MNFCKVRIMNFQSMLSLLIVLVIDIGGVRSISHGNNTVGDLKYQVFFLRIGQFTCSGVAIDERHILTAAHCVNMYKESPQMITAERSISEESRDVYNVQEIHIHSNFRMCEYNNEKVDLDNDIAILAVVPPISYEENTARIQLMTREPRECEICIIAGWGREQPDIANASKRLLWTETMILPSDLCLLMGSENSENQLCTVDLNGQSTALQGDSGGPLVCSGILSGIMSMSVTDPKLPVTHTKVYSMSSSSFIKAVVEKSMST